MGRPAHKPTDQTRMIVTVLAAAGSTQAEIAGCLGLSAETLRKYYRAELNHGRENIDPDGQGWKMRAARKGSVRAALDILRAGEGRWKGGGAIEGNPT